MGKTAVKSIGLQDVQAVSLVDIPIQPGIVKLVGNNGTGKSTAITALVSGVTGKNLGLKPRDGKMSGKIRMPGATVSIGTRLKKTPTGEEVVPFVIVEDGQGITKILRPGLKDEKAADKKRLEGVLGIIGAKLTDETVREFLGEHYVGFVKDTSIAEMSFVDAVKAMKLYLEEVARGFESQAKELTGAITQIGEIADVEVSVDIDALETQIEDLAVSVRQKIGARDLADKAAVALAKFSTAADEVSIQAQIDSLARGIVDRQAEAAKIRKAMDDLQSQLSNIEASMNRQETDLRLKTAELDAVRKQAEQAASFRASIDSAPSAESIEADRVELERLKLQHNTAIVARSDASKAEEQRQQLAKMKADREKAEAVGESLREKVTKLPTLLHTAMKQVPGWTVDEDFRLCVEHKRGQIPFSELSPGEGLAKVCLLACQFAHFEEGTIPIVGLPQECFEGLDGNNVKFLTQMAVERGLCIVTGERSVEDMSEIQVAVLN